MRRTFGIAMVFSLIAGCANTAALEAEMSRLRRELHFVRQDLAKQKRVVDGLERRMTLVALNKGGVPPVEAPVAEPAATPMAMAEPPMNDTPQPESFAPPRRRKTLPVVRLGANAQPKPVRQEDWVDPGAQDDGGPPLKFEIGPAQGGGNDRLSVDRSVLEQPDPVLDPNRPRRGPAPAVAPAPKPRRSGSRPQAKSAYKAALAKLRENKQPKAALEMFDAFLLSHPKSKFADNAAYWRGECLLALEKHDQAIAAFDILMRRHPRSPKVPFALVRKGEIFLSQGQKPAAIEAWKKVTTDYSTSEAAQTAKGLLAQQAQ